MSPKLKNAVLPHISPRQIRILVGAICVTGSLLLIGIKMFRNDQKLHDQKLPASCACFTSDAVIASLKDANLLIPNNNFTLRRNEARNKLYVSPYDTPSGPAVIVASTDGVRVMPCPARIIFLNSVDEAVAWSNDLSKGVQFRNGYFLGLSEFGLFDVSPSGDYFIIGEKPHSTWIGRTARPELRTCVSTNMLATEVFEASGKLYIAGHSFKQKFSERIRDSMCLVVSSRTNTFELVDTIQFLSDASMTDVSESGDQILLKDVTEFSIRWLLYDSRTRKMRAFGTGVRWCFFLNDDVFPKKIADY